MKLLRIIFSILFLSFILNGNVYAKNGKGELKLTKQTMQHFIAYLYGSNDKYGDGKNKKNNPYLMTVSANGRSSYYFFCPATITQCQDAMTRDTSAIPDAINRCEKLSGGTKCYVFAKFRKIVWNNGSNRKLRNIPRKLLKDSYKIAEVVQELGFYDGDITKLPAMDYETGLVDKSKKINKSKKITKKKKVEDGDIVKQLKELNSLLESGVISAEEFDKAKKKILE